MFIGVKFYRAIISSAAARRTLATVPPLTVDRYPSLYRDPRFSLLCQEDIEFFRHFLPENRVITDKDTMMRYNIDWMNKYRGQSGIVLQPSTTLEVSRILQHCHARSLAVVPQGGNTGLVGGSVPVFDEIVLSSEKMKTIHSFDPLSGIVVCDSGCVLAELDTFLATHGFMAPLDLGAKGSCHIGGNVATNAGGVRLLRYGSLHGNVLGLEVVLPDGTILDQLQTLRKDNTGYDLKQLFIGSEGTLGFITKIALLTPNRPKHVNVAVLACPSFGSVLNAYAIARENLSEILSAFEFFDEASFQLVLHHFATQARSPFQLHQHHPFYVLIEISGSNASHDNEKLGAFLEMLMDQRSVTDGVVAQDETQITAFWRLRELIPEATARHGSVMFKYDVSLPLPAFYELVNVTRERLKDNDDVTAVVGYGHVGDGNLHLNVSAKCHSVELLNQLEPFIYEWTAQQNGSISAEHGVGLMKSQMLHYSKKPAAIRLMSKFKKLIDEKGIMNPYKVIAA